MKVKILKQVGQVGLRKVGTIVETIELTGKHWIKNGWAEGLSKPDKSIPDKPQTDKPKAKKKK